MGRRVDIDDLVSATEIAERAGVVPSAVANWKARHEDFPKPIATLGGRDLFLWSEVNRWLDQPVIIRRAPRRKGLTDHK